MVDEDDAAVNPVLKWGVLLFMPALCLLVGAIFLPSPVNTSEAREKVDRKDLGDIVSTSQPDLKAELNAELGDFITIVGADFPHKAVKSGDEITITTVMKVRAETDRNWKMFVHIDLDTGRHRVHGDHFVAHNRYPSSLWKEGEFITDRFEKKIDSDAPAGRYDIFVGFYIGDERLPFTGGDAKAHSGDNRIKLGSITVE